MTRHGLHFPPPGGRGRQFGYIMAGMGWQAHIGGLVGGVAAGWIFRERRPKAPAKPAPATGSTTGLNFPGAQPGRPAP